MPCCASVSAIRMRAMATPELCGSRGSKAEPLHRFRNRAEAVVDVLRRHQAEVAKAEDLAGQRALTTGEHRVELGARGLRDQRAVDAFRNLHRGHGIGAMALSREQLEPEARQA